MAWLFSTSTQHSTYLPHEASIVWNGAWNIASQHSSSSVQKTHTSWVQSRTSTKPLYYYASATFVRSTKAQWYWKPSKPFHVGIHWIMLSLRTLRWVPMCQGLSHFSGVLHYFVLAKLATSSIRVNYRDWKQPVSWCTTCWPATWWEWLTKWNIKSPSLGCLDTLLLISCGRLQFFFKCMLDNKFKSIKEFK